MIYLTYTKAWKNLERKKRNSLIHRVLGTVRHYYRPPQIHGCQNFVFNSKSLCFICAILIIIFYVMNCCVQRCIIYTMYNCISISNMCNFWI